MCIRKYSVLLVFGIICSLLGCANPEEEANRIFTEASQLLRDASNYKDKSSFAAFLKVKQSNELLTQITEKYPSSSIAVEISKGSLLLNGKTLADCYDDPNTTEVFKELASKNDLEKVQTIVDYHEVVNTSKLKEILGLACLLGLNSSVLLLLDNDLDINEGWYGHSPINWAVDGCNIETVKILMGRGANIHAPDEDGDTPLANAIWARMPAIAELLLDSGADINCKDKEGRTPIYVAALLGNLPTAKLLVRRGAKLDLPKGTSLLEQARAREKNPFGANIGFTPLIVAAWNGNYEVVKLLVSARANLQLKDSKGKTAMDYAKTPKIRELLSETVR